MGTPATPSSFQTFLFVPLYRSAIHSTQGTSFREKNAVRLHAEDSLPARKAEGLYASTWGQEFMDDLPKPCSKERKAEKAVFRLRLT